jgi:hypothetical protein
MINCRDQNAVENMLNARTGVLDVSQVMRCPDSDCSVTFDVIVAALLRNHSINNLYFPLHFALAVDQMHAFNDLLRHNISITELSLNGSLIPEELFGIVAPGLSENSVIRTLKIGNIRNNSARGAAVLAHALSTHTSIAIADLSLCSHLVAYLPALGVNLSITDLKLCRTSWTVNEGQLLADALVRNSTLKSLNLSMSFMNGDVFRAMMPGFAANQTLERLNFTAVFTNSAENDCVDLAELISQASSLRTLILSSTLFSDDAISRFAAALASNTTLTRLNLSYSSISDCHMQALCSALEQNIHLAELSLVRNAFGHRGIQSLNKMLQRNLALRNLSLAENPLAFDAVGWNLFAKTLQGNRTLTQVDLPSILHIFTNDMFHSLAAVLSNNSTLTRLKLNDQTYSCGDGSGIAAVASALQHNYTLTDLQIRTGSQGPNDVLVRIRALCRVCVTPPLTVLFHVAVVDQRLFFTAQFAAILP